MYLLEISTRRQLSRYYDDAKDFACLHETPLIITHSTREKDEKVHVKKQTFRST